MTSVTQSNVISLDSNAHLCPAGEGLGPCLRDWSFIGQRGGGGVLKKKNHKDRFGLLDFPNPIGPIGEPSKLRKIRGLQKSLILAHSCRCPQVNNSR